MCPMHHGMRDEFQGHWKVTLEDIQKNQIVKSSRGRRKNLHMKEIMSKQREKYQLCNKSKIKLEWNLILTVAK